jgi:toxin secretion/phage lysis holin
LNLPDVLKPIVDALSANGVTYLAMFMGVDVVMGVLAAFGAKKLNSTVSWLGMIRKMGTLLIVALCFLIQMQFGWPLVSISVFFFSITEGLSILEKAKMLGIPLPKALTDALEKGNYQPSEPTIKLKPEEEV